MYITIDERDKRPLYQQVADEIKGLIAAGELPQGSSLPPVRQVAADLGVNLNTVAFAYRRLQKEGLIKVKHGSGALVTSRMAGQKPDDQVKSQLRAALTDLVLAGLTRAEISALVSEVLDGMIREK
ncbi:MAG: GntR family transcriptional regulator [Pyrinomonadaceae bacterium]|nr:GntR family transcriptional regulator [Pyrinomonadaceae bacterium]